MTTTISISLLFIKPPAYNVDPLWCSPMHYQILKRNNDSI